MMTAHVLYKALDDQLPATLSPNIITHLLREQMGYDGVVLTDDLEMHAIVDHYGPGDAAVRAFLAGCDMLLICKDRDREIAAFEAMEKAVASGTIDTARLDQSVARIQRIKQRYLLPYRPAVISDAKLIAGCRTHQALLQSIRQANLRLERKSAARGRLAVTGTASGLMGLKKGDVIDERKRHPESCGLVLKVMGGGEGFEKIICCDHELTETDLVPSLVRSKGRKRGQLPRPSFSTKRNCTPTHAACGS